MSLSSIEGKEKLYRISTLELRRALAFQPDSFRDLLRNSSSTDGEYVFALPVTLNEETTPKKLRCFVSYGNAWMTLDDRTVDYDNTQTVTFYDRIFVWEAAFPNKVFDLEECFPRFRVHAVPRPTLVSEVTAIKNLLIEALALQNREKDQEKEQKQQEDELGALD